MKTHIFNSIFFAGTLGLASLLPAAARASDTNAVTRPRAAGRHVEMDTTKWDLNKNGRLDPDELQAAREDMLRERAERFEGQRKAALQVHQSQLARRGIPRVVPAAVLNAYDANKNGILDPDEWTRYRADQARNHGTTFQSTNGASPTATTSNPAAEKP